MMGKNIRSKSILLNKIKPLLKNLPMDIFFKILLYLNFECVLFLEAAGLQEQLIACVRSYPEYLYRRWKNFNLSLPGPKLFEELVSPSSLSLVTCFSKFFTSVSQMPLSSNLLFAKMQIDAITATFSAFNPLFPLIGMSLNNDFTYYVFATDSCVYREETTVFTHHSHVKYIFDFPDRKIEGVSWSPNGEILGIITKLASLTPVECALKRGLFPVEINLAQYIPSTGLIREFVGIGREIFAACSRFITPNFWIDDNAILTVESSGKKFRKLVIDTNRNEFTEYHQNTTSNLLKFVDSMESANHLSQKNIVGGMSVSKFYPKNVAGFIIRCSAHSGSSHSSILFYDFVKDVALKKFDLSGFVRSTYICPKKTVIYVERNHRVSFNKRRDNKQDLDPYIFCSKEAWFYKLDQDAVRPPRVYGDIYAVSHDTLSLQICTDPTILNLDHNYDEHYYKTCYSTTPSDIYACLYSSALDRSLQACETYAFVCTENSCNVQTLERLTFSHPKPYSVRTVYASTRKRQGCVSISPCGFLTFAEYSNFWKKPQIYYSPYMPSRNSPGPFMTYYSKLYYEKPIKITKKYASPV